MMMLAGSPWPPIEVTFLYAILATLFVFVDHNQRKLPSTLWISKAHFTLVYHECRRRHLDVIVVLPTRYSLVRIAICILSKSDGQEIPLD